jgi:hypothetical protein
MNRPFEDKHSQMNANNQKQKSNNGSNHYSNDTDTIALSDSSTLQPDVNLKYNTCVKELISEHNEHLNDLRILRRIFQYLFTVACYKSLDQDTKTKNEELPSELNEIFGNINDVYECALKLADEFDSANVKASNSQILVGESFWSLAEGNEFDVYARYAEKVSNPANSLKHIEDLFKKIPTISSFLSDNCKFLPDMVTYLLPKLLIGPIYHAIYLREKVEYLKDKTVFYDQRDKDFLESSFDTLDKLKNQIDRWRFKQSQPVEYTLRLFSHQEYWTKTVDKWRNIEDIVDSLKIPSNYLSSISSPKLGPINWNNSFINKPNSQSQSELNTNSCEQTSNSEITTISRQQSFKNETSIQFLYLHEDTVTTYRTQQSIADSKIPDLKILELKDSKYKSSKRHVYLFDGLIIFVKKQGNTMTKKNSKESYKFKQAISLDKCVLRDRRDPLFFELNIFNNNNATSPNNITPIATTTADNNNNILILNSSPLSSFNNNDNQECILFKADTPEKKYHWMSMLCYSIYKKPTFQLLDKMTQEFNRRNPLKIPPTGYTFDEADIPETIIFEHDTQNKKDSDLTHTHPETTPTNNPYLNSSERLNIRAATFLKLVERLTHYKYFSNQKALHDFLMCFREFSSPSELLRLLTLRYNIPDLSVEQMEIVNENNFEK